MLSLPLNPLPFTPSLLQPTRPCRLCQFTHYAYDPLVRSGKKKERHDLPSCANRIDAENAGIIRREFTLFSRRKSSCYQGFENVCIHIRSILFIYLIFDLL